MSREEAVEKIMEDWNAGNGFRPFIERFVDEYMGVAENVLSSDINKIKEMIREIL